MTREEAIECIKAIHVQMFNSGTSKWTEALDVAIEALKGTIKPVAEISVSFDEEKLQELIDEAVAKVVEERPHGEWIEKTGIGEYCSNCNRQGDSRFTYCPWCGSKNECDE